MTPAVGTLPASAGAHYRDGTGRVAEEERVGTRPCVIIPGIKGTGLENIYTLPPEVSCSATQALEQTLVGLHFDRLALDDRGEDDESDVVLNRATQLLQVAYGSMASALRGRQEAPVYLFPYDWRLSAERSALTLVRFVRRLLGKTFTTLT